MEIMAMGTVLVCIDVEANGIDGPPFAVGACALGDRHEPIAVFAAKCPITGGAGPTPWVMNTVVPMLHGISMQYLNVRDMMGGFFDWLMGLIRQHDVLLFADWGYPVDHGFMVRMRTAILPQRKLNFPLVVHEVATLFLAAGRNPDESRSELIHEEMVGREPKKHNPLWDAEVSARAARKLLRELEGRRE
jgi:hypothetical protein